MRIITYPYMYLIVYFSMSIMVLDDLTVDELPSV